jgi:hypothetical protein
MTADAWARSGDDPTDPEERVHELVRPVCADRVLGDLQAGQLTPRVCFMEVQRRCGVGRGPWLELPAVARPDEMPSPARAEPDLDGRAGGRFGFVLVWKRPYECAEDLGKEAVMLARLSNGVSDVLLVDPTLREVPAEVEPARNGAARRPDDATRTLEVEGCVVLVDFPCRPSEEIHDDTTAEPKGPDYPSLVLRVQRAYEFAVVPVSREQSRHVAITTAGEPTKIVIQQVERDVLHPPVTRISRGDPLNFGETIEQGEQVVALDPESVAWIEEGEIRQLHRIESRRVGQTTSTIVDVPRQCHP